MIEIKDQTGNVVRLGKTPERIICLVPSITELLYDLGLDEAVVGITKFCVHPAHWFKNKARVGGTKTVLVEKVTALDPDFIIANKEENVRAQIEELAAVCPVYISDIGTLNDALEMIREVGLLVGKSVKANELVSQIDELFQQSVPLKKPVKTCYLIWQKPFITVGGDTFISDMLEKCGFINIAANQVRYPEITLQKLAEMDCELVLLSSEPFPFKQKQVEEIRGQLHVLGSAPQIGLVDGEMFSWYGSRMLQAPVYFKQLQNRLLMSADERL